MVCSRVQNLLSAYCDSELTGAEMLHIRQHLRTCSACGREYESVRRVKALFGGLRQVEPPGPPDLELIFSKPYQSPWSWGALLGRWSALGARMAAVRADAAAGLTVWQQRVRAQSGAALAGGMAVAFLAGAVWFQPQQSDAVAVHVPEAIPVESTPEVGGLSSGGSLAAAVTIPGVSLLTSDPVTLPARPASFGQMGPRFEVTATEPLHYRYIGVVRGHAGPGSYAPSLPFPAASPALLIHSGRGWGSR